MPAANHTSLNHTHSTASRQRPRLRRSRLPSRISLKTPINAAFIIVIIIIATGCDHCYFSAHEISDPLHLPGGESAFSLLAAPF